MYDLSSTGGIVELLAATANELLQTVAKTACAVRRLLRLRHVVDVVPALSAVAEVAASRTDLESFILRLTLQVCIDAWPARLASSDYLREGC